MWADCHQFRPVELRVSALLALSLIEQECDDVFRYFIKAFSFPIADSYANLRHKSSSGKGTSYMLDEKNNHFNHKQTRDLKS